MSSSAHLLARVHVMVPASCCLCPPSRNLELFDSTTGRGERMRPPTAEAIKFYKMHKDFDNERSEWRVCSDHYFLPLRDKETREAEQPAKDRCPVCLRTGEFLWRPLTTRARARFAADNPRLDVTLPLKLTTTENPTCCGECYGSVYKGWEALPQSSTSTRRSAQTNATAARKQRAEVPVVRFDISHRAVDTSPKPSPRTLEDSARKTKPAPVSTSFVEESTRKTKPAHVSSSSVEESARKTKPAPMSSSSVEDSARKTKPAPVSTSSVEESTRKTKPAHVSSSSVEESARKTKPAPVSTSSVEDSARKTKPAPLSTSFVEESARKTKPAPVSSSSVEQSSRNTKPAPVSTSSVEESARKTKPAHVSSSSVEDSARKTKPAPVSTSSAEDSARKTKPASPPSSPLLEDSARKTKPTPTSPASPPTQRSLAFASPALSPASSSPVVDVKDVVAAEHDVSAAMDRFRANGDALLAILAEYTALLST